MTTHCVPPRATFNLPTCADCGIGLQLETTGMMLRNNPAGQETSYCLACVPQVANPVQISG